MVDIGNWTTKEDIEMKAGSGMSTASFGTSSMILSAAQAEGVLNTATRFDWAANTSSITSASFTGMLNNVVASLVGVDAVSHDMSGYPSRIVAEDKINILRDSVLRDLSILRDIKTQEFIGAK